MGSTQPDTHKILQIAIIQKHLISQDMTQSHPPRALSCITDHRTAIDLGMVSVLPVFCIKAVKGK